MSVTNNADSVEPGKAISSSVPREGPMTTKGHAPGVQVGNDKVPTFEAQVLPAGSAPAESTFQPNPIHETPGQANNPDTLRSHGKESTYVAPDDFPGGSTSADVHTGLGHPGQGQVASDRSNKGAGSLQGTTASGINPADQRIDPNQRGISRESGNLAGKDTVSDAPAAEDKIPQSAENVAAEHSARERQDRGT